MKSTSSNLWLFLACLGGVSACVDTPELDGRDDTFLGDGKADDDGFVVLEGSPEAAGVLRVVNELKPWDLTGKVHLTSGAVDAIVVYRAGPDKVLGTSDDKKFETLQRLDQLPYVGPNSFKALLDYALAHDYVVRDPNDPLANRCAAGVRMTYDRLYALGNRREIIELPAVAVSTYGRSKTGTGELGPWEVRAPLTNQYTVYDWQGHALRTTSENLDQARAVFSLKDGKYLLHVLSPTAYVNPPEGWGAVRPSIYSHGFAVINCQEAGGSLTCLGYGGNKLLMQTSTATRSPYSSGNDEFLEYSWGGSFAYKLAGSLTENCFHVTLTEQTAYGETVAVVSGMIPQH